MLHGCSDIGFGRSLRLTDDFIVLAWIGGCDLHEFSITVKFTHLHSI
jgi:hypothetical protein